MYDIIFKRDGISGKQTQDFVVLSHNLPTLEAACAARKVSGDLVVYSGSDRVVPSMDWLWDWERANPKTYAHKAILYITRNIYQP